MESGSSQLKTGDQTLLMRQRFYLMGFNRCPKCFQRNTIKEKVPAGCRFNGDGYGTTTFTCKNDECKWYTSFQYDEDCDYKTPYYYETKGWFEQLMKEATPSANTRAGENGAIAALCDRKCLACEAPDETEMLCESGQGMIIFCTKCLQTISVESELISETMRPLCKAFCRDYFECPDCGGRQASSSSDGLVASFRCKFFPQCLGDVKYKYARLKSLLDRPPCDNCKFLKSVIDDARFSIIFRKCAAVKLKCVECRRFAVDIKGQDIKDDASVTSSSSDSDGSDDESSSSSSSSSSSISSISSISNTSNQSEA